MNISGPVVTLARAAAEACDVEFSQWWRRVALRGSNPEGFARNVNRIDGSPIAPISLLPFAPSKESVGGFANLDLDEMLCHLRFLQGALRQTIAAIGSLGIL